MNSSMKELNLPMITEANASPEVAELYAHFRESFGRPQVPGILQCVATHPPLLEHMMGLAKSMLFVDGALGRANKEMLATFVSSRNHCEYCADSHGYALRMNGGSAAMLDAAMTCNAQTKMIEPAQAKLLQFVEKVTDDSQSITPDDVAALRSAAWTDLQIAEAIHMAALFACFNRVVNAFGLPSQNMLATMGASL
jgi:uncharacterized peroxidase-related enzyme